MVVGAPLDNELDTGAGAAYVYRLDATGSTLQLQLVKKLLAPDGAAHARFGSSVTISSDGLVAVGAPLSSNNGLVNSGAAYIYRISATDAVQFLGKVVADDGTHHSSFGYSVAAGSDGLVVIGAYRHAHNGLVHSGAAYILLCPRVVSQGVQR